MPASSILWLQQQKQLLEMEYKYEGNSSAHKRKRLAWPGRWHKAIAGIR